MNENYSDSAETVSYATVKCVRQLMTAKTRLIHGFGKIILNTFLTPRIGYVIAQASGCD